MKHKIRANYDNPRTFHAAQRLRFKEATRKQSEERRDFPEESQTPRETLCTKRKAVCRRCHVVMQDAEPLCSSGEFYHPPLDKEGKPHWCRNAGITFTTRDLEIVPFLPKARRRALKRMGIRP